MKELRSINKYLYKYRYRLILGVLFVALSNWFGVFPAQVIRLAFDLVKENISIYSLFDEFETRNFIYQIFSSVVLLFGAIIFLVAVIKGVFMFFMRQTIIVMSRLIEYDMKNEIYDQYQKLSLSFYRRNNTGDLMNRVGEDVSRVRMYIGPAIMYTLNLLVLFILVISTMISVDPKLTLYSLLPLPLLFFSIYYVQNIINLKSEKIQEQLSNLSTFVQESFSGIRVLKAYVREKKYSEDFSVESDDYKNRSMELMKVQAVFFPLILALVGMSTILTIYIGGQEVIRGTITAGNIAEFIVYVNMLTWPVTTVGWVTSLVQRAAASQKRINEFLHTKPEIITPSAPAMEIKGEIEFKNISFTYPDTGIEAIKDLSFKIEPGKTLAIIGRTGSGKSTIANLIVRMYDVTSGEILIDGKNIRSIQLDSLRKQIGFVPQEVFLFSDTIEQNIAFGMNRFDQHEIVEAARSAVIYDNIMRFEEGFQTRIGERGITLSGGQKQRVSIARAIIKQPKILLFDDALSAVDTKTEEEILKNLGKIMKGRTTIMISHRVSTIKNADHILMIDQGMVIESGTHMKLMEQKGNYYELYEKQLMEEESDINQLSANSH
jgi:ATP-binding cassette, subfamily B, multidrug efflux pump